MVVKIFPLWLLIGCVLSCSTLLCSVSSAFTAIQHGIRYRNRASASLPVPLGSTRMYPKRSDLRRGTVCSMVSYSNLNEKIPSSSIIDAVERSPDKVIASDIATSAGVSLSEARKELTTLASLTLGDIAVSSSGELIYSFPSDIKGVLSSRSSKYKAQQLFKKAWPSLFWGIRVSFGVALVISLFAIYSTIFFISSGSSDDDRRDDRRGGFGGGGMGFGYSPFWGPSPLDFFYYRPYGYYGYYSQPDRDPEEMGFFESVFSYIFGDGNPNEQLEEKRLSLAAQMIRDNQGAVTAEQLAPFCDDDTPDIQEASQSNYVDEAFVLPIVTQLNGEPRVTDTGDIIYVFPDLQMSTKTSQSLSSSSSSRTFLEKSILKRAGMRGDASSGEIKRLLSMNGINSRGAVERSDLIAILEKYVPPQSDEEQEENHISSDSSMLYEREYKFSLAPGFNKVLAGGLGVVNLGGALYLGNILSSAAMYGVKLPSYFGVVQAFYPLLLGYAILFNLIPLGRNFWINQQNEKIRQRNKKRAGWKNLLSSASTRIKQKLSAAKNYRMKMKKLGSSQKDIIFDTTAPMEQIELKKEKDDLDEFDKLLGDDNQFQ